MIFSEFIKDRMSFNHIAFQRASEILNLNGL